MDGLFHIGGKLSLKKKLPAIEFILLKHYKEKN